MPARPVIVAQNDPIIRIVQVLIDPATPAERQAAVADYFSVDLPDFAAWRDDLRRRFASVCPANMRMVDDQAAFETALPEAEAAIVEDLAVGAPQLDRAPRLKAVQKFGVDTRNIDGAACRARGVAMLTLRRRVNVAVAEHAFALMLALAKKICALDKRIDTAALEAAGYAPRMFDRRHVGAANWARVGGLQTLAEMSLGVLGLGETGREMAARAHAFGMSVFYHQRHRLPAEIERPLGAAYLPFEALLERSDVVSVHLPHTPQTRGMIDAAAFSRMKPGALLINVARAEIVERGALLDALGHGRLGGAGLDVHYEEPAAPGDPLTAYDNVVLTPHVAVGSRRNNVLDMEELVAKLAGALRP